jgi:DNA-3-methyladenine glycosylase II
MLRFTKENLHPLCDRLAAKDVHLKSILSTYGYPPLWIRSNTFETLVLTILEQQVSLASAYAAYKKLKEKIPETTPQHLLALTDEELRSCYFSRQKIGYVRGLAEALISEELNLEKLETEEDDVVREKLKKLKGIGDWTVDIYLLHALQRTNIFPLGDLALVKAVQMVLEQPLTKERSG